LKWRSGKLLSWWRNEVLGGDDTTGEMSAWVLRMKKLSERKITKESRTGERLRQRSRACEEGCQRHSNQCDSYKRSFLLEMLRSKQKC